MKILSFTQPQDIPKLFHLLSSVGAKKYSDFESIVGVLDNTI